MNINYTQVIKKQTQIIALSVFVMVIGILGVSYALFMKVDQSEEQTVQSGSLIMQLSAYDGSTVITDNNTPIDDNEGLLSKGYSFSVTNNGTLPITYYIALYDNPDDTSTNKVNYDYIKVSLDNGTPFTLGSITSKDSAGRSILKQDISLAPDKYDTHNIKIWLDEDTPESEIGKTISLKIYAYGEVCEDGECNGGTLPPVKKIISQLDTTGKCPTVNEDGSVSVTGVEATDGYLCKAKDAYGDSYYYRGNVTNNYVRFGTWSNDTPTLVVDEYGHEYDSLDDCKNDSDSYNCTELARAGKDMYWRIVRINGDGTVRVIYDGTSAHANGESSKDRQIGTSAFNNSYMDNAYVGYMYGDRTSIVEPTSQYSTTSFTNINTYYIAKEYTYNASTDRFTLKDPIAVLGSAMTSDYVGYYTFESPSASFSNSYVYKIFSVTAGSSSARVGYGYVTYATTSKEAAQTNKNDSTIKTYLDNWYKTNIVGTTNEQYLADNIFCNDRSFPSSNSGTGAGMSRTYYRWYYWANSLYNNKMMLTCPQQNDAFTVSDTTNGNGALTYPVGLLSMDEMVLTGGWGDSNRGYYLYSGQYWWASSPDSFYSDDACVHHGTPNGGSAGHDLNVSVASYGVRPVFNLKAEALTYGDGTMNNPYRLTETIDSTTPSGSGSSSGVDFEGGQGEGGL